jgi:hypothetical protein
MSHEVNRLRFLIEVNRQRLHFALATQNESLKMRTLSLLTQLHSAHFDAVKAMIPMRSTETKFLVFSEAHEDGIILTATELRTLRRSMSRADLTCHVAVEIDAEMEQATEQVLIMDLEAENNSMPRKPKKIG